MSQKAPDPQQDVSDFVMGGQNDSACSARWAGPTQTICEEEQTNVVDNGLHRNRHQARPSRSGNEERQAGHVIVDVVTVSASLVSASKSQSVDHASELK